MTDSQTTTNHPESAVIQGAPSSLFQGTNSVTGEGLNTAVTGQQQVNGGSTTTKCTVNLTAEQLTQSLAISQSVSARFGLTGSASAKVDFFYSIQLTTYSVVISVTAFKPIDIISSPNKRFRPDVQLPGDNSQADRFVQLYGDSFLSSVTMGGEFIGLYIFYCQSSTEQKDLIAELEASKIGASASFDANLQIAINSLMQSTTIRTETQCYLAGIRNPVLPQGSEFIAYANEFVKTELDHLALISFETSGYESVLGADGTPGAVEAFNKISKNRIYFIGDSLCDGLTSYLQTIEECLNQMHWLDQVYHFYGYSTVEHDPQLLTFTQVAEADRTLIVEQMRLYRTQATADFPRLVYASLSNGTPELQCVPIATPTWGGGGGHPFTDVERESHAFLSKTRITSIGLRSGKRVDQLSVGVIDANRDQPEIRTYGGGGGSNKGTIHLEGKESISALSGRAGAKIDQLLIEVGQQSLAGGGSGGTAFGPWKPPADTTVLGFRGRCGEELDQLGVICAKLNPAIWEPLPKLKPLPQA